MNKQFARNLAGLFLLCRLILLISMSPEGLRGFGDFLHFYNLAGLGRPYLDIWVEFPPVFPWISWLLYQIAAGRQHIYDILLVIILSLAQAATLIVFHRLAGRCFPEQKAQAITSLYFVLTLVLPYGWWYFDPIVVWLTLYGLLLYLEERDVQSGLLLGVGILTKLFPVLLLPLIWRRSPGRAARITLLAVGLSLLIYGGLIIASPSFTGASIRSQASKGSWETVWALLDGNFDTGNFGPEIERYDPQFASQPQGNPARIPSWLTLIPFAGLGLWFFRKGRRPSAPAVLRGPAAASRAAIAFLGLTWCIFSIWSPGYSPQWVLYLLPLVLLALPLRQAVLVVSSLVLINLLEWPAMLSRGYNWGLWLTVPVRTLLWVLLVVEFWRVVQTSSPYSEGPLDSETPLYSATESSEVAWKTAGRE